MKKQTVKDILETQDLSIIRLVETHIRENNHEDLSMFHGYRTVTVERGYGEKAGGGSLLIVKDGIRRSAWNPIFPDTGNIDRKSLDLITLRRDPDSNKICIHGSAGSRK